MIACPVGIPVPVQAPLKGSAKCGVLHNTWVHDWGSFHLA